jgi:hypothetical protein
MAVIVVHNKASDVRPWEEKTEKPHNHSGGWHNPQEPQKWRDLG